MAGEPAPLQAVQAAVLKSSAGAQGQKPPGAAIHENAVAQDLAVMADQAAGYTQGVIKGNAEQESNRGMQASRLAQEAAQAAAERQRALEMDRMQTQEAQLRLAMDAEEGNRQLMAARQASVQDNTAERAAENMQRVKTYALAHQKPEFADVFDAITSEATNYKEAMDLYDNFKRQGAHVLPAINVVSRDAIARYARTYYDAAKGGAVNLRRDLDKPGGRRDPSAARRRAAEQESKDGGGQSIGEKLYQGYRSINPFD